MTADRIGTLRFPGAPVNGRTELANAGKIPERTFAARVQREEARSPQCRFAVSWTSRTQVHLWCPQPRALRTLLSCTAGHMELPVQLRMASGLFRDARRIRRKCKCTAVGRATPLSGYCAVGLRKLTGYTLRTARKCGGQSEPVQIRAEGWKGTHQDGCMAWNLLWLLLLLLWCMSTAGALEVEMAEGTQLVSRNDNVIIPCKVPGSPHLDTKTMGILWFQKNESEVTVFELYGNHLKALRPGAMVSRLGLERGDASLQLPGVQLWEAGEYRCKLVVTPEKAEGKTRLEVVAHPAITLTEGHATMRNDSEKHILCKVDGFYPEAISIKWVKRTPKDPNFQEITEGVDTSLPSKREDGSFSVTSQLKLKSSLEDSGTTYQCVVEHKSLPTPTRFNITLSEEKSTKTNFLWIILVFLLIFLMAACYFHGNRSSLVRSLNCRRDQSL
ncbi:natural cytotoxicity triggering receptor 3 ligand 1-like isoform X2 [Nannospalax galili]|uniref:natural cytotoxicity triggering receptor 3 ligand 1-like isoform X2 n=1 Tax=Nannospalax galili TaxID=1026970 RepID=UPI00111C6CED|nr:natural cytotoxicity triggering receptor 3 ligand 1-like isoform X2 [Nannospalax galili]